MSRSALRPLIAGNWKMNGTPASLAELDAMVAGYGSAMKQRLDLMVCPPATLLGEAVKHAGSSGVLIGAQDCHAEQSGAHTGDISAAMIADLGVKAVIIGHSERRADHGETSANVAAKAVAVHDAALVAIICVGETRAQRDAGKALEIVSEQVTQSLPDCCTAQNTVIAYEPVWAIGTGLVPTMDDVAQVHARIRALLEQRFGDGVSMRILYGGSVKPSNAAELLGVENVNGALVGGASLKAEDFLGIAKAIL
jgi:triosephosphate isomerase (TIM)